MANLKPPPLRTTEKVALFHYAKTVSVPLVRFANDSFDHVAGIGTGSLYEKNERLFLVTARHVMDADNAHLFSIPQVHTGGKMFTLGDVNILRPDDKSIDILVVEILDASHRVALKSGWTCLSQSDLSECPTDGDFYLFGFPFENLNIHANGVQSQPLALFTKRHAGIPMDAMDQREPVYSDVDLFFHHKKSGINLDGRSFNLPRLGGMSGCSVWSYINPTDALWTPQSALKVVGVQSGFIENSYIRAKSWKWVTSILDKI